MTISIKIDGIEDGLLWLQELHWARGLGNPVSFTLLLTLEDGSVNQWDVARKLAGAALKKKLEAKIMAGNEELTPPLVVSKVSTVEHGTKPVITLSGNVSDLSKELFMPRNRVLAFNTVDEVLLGHFSNYLYAENDIRTTLDLFDTKFDERPCYLFQEAKSDWWLIDQIIRCYNLKAPLDERILLTGNEADPRWRLSWANRVKLLSVEKPTLNDADMQVDERCIFGRDVNELLIEDHNVFRPRTVSLFFKRSTVDVDPWKTWTQAPLPVFYQTNEGPKLAMQAVDVLKMSGEQDVLWSSQLVFFQEDYLEDSQNLNTSLNWIGFGKVTKRDEKSSWIDVKINGFEDGYNQAQVQLTTLYAGDDGQNGFHLVPEENTEVSVLKPNHWLAAPLFAGNLRAIGSKQESPSWSMAKPMKWKLDELAVNLKKLETISEGLVKTKAKTAEMETEDAIKLSTNGVKISIDNTDMQIS